MLTFFQRQAYASGAFTKSTLWNFTDLLLLYYFADIQGLGAAAAGLILMVSLLVSGVLDISLSLLLDRYNLHYQKVILRSFRDRHRRWYQILGNSQDLEVWPHLKTWDKTKFLRCL